MPQTTLQPSTFGMGNTVHQMLDFWHKFREGLTSYKEIHNNRPAKIMPISCGRMGVFVGMSQTHQQMGINSSLMTTPGEGTVEWLHQSKQLDSLCPGLCTVLGESKSKGQYCPCVTNTGHERWGGELPLLTPYLLCTVSFSFFFFFVLMPKKRFFFI